MNTVRFQADGEIQREGTLVSRAAGELAIRLPNGWIMNLRPAKGFMPGPMWESVDTKKLYRVELDDLQPQA